MDEKTCTKCGETKPLDEFSRQRSTKSGRRARCRECIKAEYRSDPRPAIERAKKRRERFPEKVAEEQRRYREENAERIRATRQERADLDREAQRAWRAKRAEHVKEYGQKYRARNAARINEAVRLRRAASPAHAEYMRRYREENADRIAETARRWRDANPHVWWLSNYRRRADKYGVNPLVEDFTKADVIERHGDSCFYCETGPFENLDHFVPVKAGGPHTLENVRPSCFSCNRAKADADPDEWLAEQAALDDLTEDELDDLIDAEIDRWTQPKESK